MKDFDFAVPRVFAYPRICVSAYPLINASTCFWALSSCWQKRMPSKINRPVMLFSALNLRALLAMAATALTGTPGEIVLT